MAAPSWVHNMSHELLIDQVIMNKYGQRRCSCDWSRFLI